MTPPVLQVSSWGLGGEANSCDPEENTNFIFNVFKTFTESFIQFWHEKTLMTTSILQV